MNDLPATAGHNLPPADEEMSQEEIIHDRLADTYEEAVKRAGVLSEALARVPGAIKDDDTNKRASDYVSQLTKHMKTLNGHRELEKAPYLNGGRAVDGFFKALTGVLDQAKKSVLARKTTYERAKAAEERRRREEEERKAAEEAARLQRLADEAAESAFNEAALDLAIDIEGAAQQAAADAERAARAAAAKAAELSASRSDLGSHSGLRANWTGTVQDYDTLDLEKLRPHIPRDALDRAVKAYAKLHKADDVRGAYIFEVTQSVVQ